MGRVHNNNQEEGVLSRDAHEGFNKTTGLRAFEVVHLLNSKMPGLRSKLKLKLYSLACVLIVAKHDGYM